MTGAGGLNQSLTVSYTNNTNAGTATASASYDRITRRAATARRSSSARRFGGGHGPRATPGRMTTAAHGATSTVVGRGQRPDGGVGSSLTLGASFIDAPGGTANWAFSGEHFQLRRHRAGRQPSSSTRRMRWSTVRGYTGCMTASATAPPARPGRGARRPLAAAWTSGASLHQRARWDGHWTFTGGTATTPMNRARSGSSSARRPRGR